MLKETMCGALVTKAVVGLGNPDRTDDGVGVAVVEGLKGCTGAQIFTAVKTGLDLMMSLLSYDKVLVVDATPSLPTGEVALFRLTCRSGTSSSPSSSPSPPTGEKGKFLIAGEGERRQSVSRRPAAPAFPTQAARGFLHGLDFVRAWSLVRDLGLKVPEVWILAIGIPAEPRFGRGLSPEVSAALPKAREVVERWLQT